MPWKIYWLPGSAPRYFLPSLGHSLTFLGSSSFISCACSPSLIFLLPLLCPHTPFFTKSTLRTEGHHLIWAAEVSAYAFACFHRPLDACVSCHPAYLFTTSRGGKTRPHALPRPFSLSQPPISFSAPGF